MNVSEGSLRALVAAVDDQHRAGMDGMQDQIRELHAESRKATGIGAWRKAAIGGAAIAIGSQVLPLGKIFPAYAADGDAGVAAFAQSVELTAVAAYTAAAKSGKVTTKAILDAATKFAGHHTEHAAAFGGAAGSAATNKLNQKLLDAVSPGLTAAKTEMDVVKIAFDLEQAAAATYLFALGALTSATALQLTASILPTEAQHAVVLGTVLGADPTTYLPNFQTEDGYIDPSKFPAA